MLTGKPHHRGKRGGRSRRDAEVRDIHSYVRGVHRATASKDSPTGATLERSARFFSCAEIDETVATHVIPRKSVTVRQMLAATHGTLETETRHAKQLDHKGHTVFTSVADALARGRMIETTDQRQVYRSVRTLLVTGTPGATVGTFKRDGLIRKGLNTQRIRTTEREVPLVDVILGPAVDIENPEFLDN